MGFLSNSGDICVDAVITDAGRKRLAQGDGSFKIVKFALFDDEVDYSLYNKSHASGSAYFDLQVLQTPIFEAFTNNGSVGKHKLVSLFRSDLLYLPTMKLNNVRTDTGMYTTFNSYVVAVDEDTEDLISAGSTAGVIKGLNTDDATYIRVDHGLDTSEISPVITLPADLTENQYIIEIDSKFGDIISVGDNTTAKVSYVDDDGIASYYFSLGSDTEFVKENTSTVADSEIIAGPRGTFIKFSIRASLDLSTTTYLFTRLGGTVSIGGNNYYYIDAFIRVMGATTGTSVDVPVRFVKAV